MMLIKVIKLLFDANTSLNEKDFYGNNILYIVFKIRKINFIKFLIEKIKKIYLIKLIKITNDFGIYIIFKTK